VASRPGGPDRNGALDVHPQHRINISQHVVAARDGACADAPRPAKVAIDEPAHRGARAASTIGAGVVSDSALQRLVDESAIRNLLVAYTLGIDERDADAVARCFATGAELDWEHLGVGPVEDLLPIVFTANAQFLHHQHFLNQSLITVDGDAASSHAYGLAFLRAGGATGADDGPFDLVVGIHYRDRLERRAGGWAIVRREVRTPWMRRDPVGAEGPLVPDPADPPST
jgi:hypothetical protein